MAFVEGRASDFCDFYIGKMKLHKLKDEDTYIALLSTRPGYYTYAEQVFKFNKALEEAGLNILYRGEAVNWYINHRNDDCTKNNERILKLIIFETKKCTESMKPVPPAAPPVETPKETTSLPLKTAENIALRADIKKRDQYGRFMKHQWK